MVFSASKLFVVILSSLKYISSKWAENDKLIYFDKTYRSPPKTNRGEAEAAMQMSWRWQWKAFIIYP